MLNGVFWRLNAGAPWRDLPECFGPWRTVYDRFRKWSQRGLWDRILRHLQARKMHSGEIDWSLFCIDGAVVRAHQSAAGAVKSAGRRAGGPRPRPQPRRLRHEAAPDLRRRGHADRRRRRAGAGA